MRAKQFNFTPGQELTERMRVYSQESGVPMAEMVRRAVEAYLAQGNHNQQIAEDLGQQEGDNV